VAGRFGIDGYRSGHALGLLQRGEWKQQAAAVVDARHVDERLVRVTTEMALQDVQDDGVTCLVPDIPERLALADMRL
jgi:hypothetical protein